MITKEIKEALQNLVPEDHILYDEPLKKHTTFQVGGNTDCLIFVEKERELQELFILLKKENILFFILGNGSNLLVSDNGFEGVILETKHLMNSISIDGNVITAQAGALMSKIGVEALRHSLTGFEFAAGIPGTIGGGTVMNAGAYGGELKDVIKSVRVLTTEGEIVDIPGNEMDFGYRHSIVRQKNYIISSIVIELKAGDEAQIKSRMEELTEARRSKQPLEYPSAGSTFKRPEGYFAGKLIEDAGLRGYSVGGAQVSEKHCGFVINKGNATAKDIDTLMRNVSEKVFENAGVTLEPEVIRVGKF